jgi:probable rRNA maturation factor
MLAALELQDSELSVLLTNDAHIHVLNRQHRDKDRPTDVLSFGVSDVVGARARNAPRLLGDVVISLDTAARQAKSRKRPLIAEVRWLLAHGILHLVGFDHATAAQKRRMVAFTRRLVRAAELPDAKPPRAVKRRSRA